MREWRIRYGAYELAEMADGPAVQAAGLRALNAGQTMIKTLALVREFRKGDDATPIVLMGYYNPIYIYGVDRFLAEASRRVEATIPVGKRPRGIRLSPDGTQLVYASRQDSATRRAPSCRGRRSRSPMV